MLLLLCTVLLGTAVAQNPTTQENPSYRLTGEAIPLNYEITIEPDFDTFTFKGFVRITANITKFTNSILIHEDKIKTSSINVDKDGIPLKINAIERDGERNFLQISVEEDLLIGDIVDISIDYEGYLNKNNEGFYRVKSVDSNGNISWLAVTQMAPTYARQVFPCFDEPALKANFSLSIIRQAKYNSASNMNLLKTVELEANRYMDVYKTTLKMSTYLVAFIVSEFAKIGNNNQTVYGKPEAILDGYGDYALDNSQNVLTAMEKFINVPYALDKMGQVAVPNEYFIYGAMENWGLVLYGESVFFYKENVSYAGQKQTTLGMISHEYSHQWFGNLVSPMWWDYIWLNEGFATYCEYYVTNIVDPSLKMMDQFIPGVHQYAMISDAKETTRPMTLYVEYPDDIMGLFDNIAYEKAGSVIRMTEHYLSSPVFANGLNKYLNKMAYSSATATDLFDSFQESVVEMEAVWLGNLTVHEIFNTWHLQSGFPYVNAIRDYDQNILHLTQNRFYSNKNSKASNELWYIPINYASATNSDFENTTPMFWLTKQSDSLPLNENSWIIINKQSTGYYRVNYDETNWKQITNQLLKNHIVIDPLTRSLLIDDSFSLAKAGIIDYNIPLSLTEYIVNETYYIPLTTYFYHIMSLNKILATSEISETFKSHVRSLLKLAYETHSFDKDITEHTMILNREKIHSLMCRFGYEKCTIEMEQRLIESLTTNKKIHPDLQSSIYCGGMVNNNELELKWKKMYRRYTEVEIGEKTRIVEGLACSGNTDILKRILLTAAGMYHNHEFVVDDITNAINAVSLGSHLGAVTTLEFLIDNYQNFKLTHIQKFMILRNISEGLFSQKHKEMLNKLSYKLEVDVKVMNDAISNVDNNLQILHKVVPQFATYIR